MTKPMKGGHTRAPDPASAPLIGRSKEGSIADDVYDVMDFPELNDAEIADLRPFAEVFPDLAASIRRARGAQKAPTLTPVKLRLDQAVIDHFKAQGAGWHGRIREVLRKAAGLV